MHRVTPLTSAFIAATSGGARSLVDAVEDSPMMQEMKGTFLKGEMRDKIESPQNYGFTSRVLPAKKGKDGQIEEAAEAIISFIGGNRSHPIATVMDDRRHRPMGLKPGENAQYDDIGQMTLMRRGGLFMLSHDGEDGEGKKSERMVSLRHVTKKKQERDKIGGKRGSGGGSGGSKISGGGDRPQLTPLQEAELREVQERADQEKKKKREEFKHEGESVNTEVRATASKVEFRTGDSVVGHYNASGKEWQLNSGGDPNKSVKVDGQHAHIRIGENSIWVNDAGCWSSKPIEVLPDPSMRAGPSMLERIEQLEARVRALEARLA